MARVMTVYLLVSLCGVGMAAGPDGVAEPGHVMTGAWAPPVQPSRSMADWLAMHSPFRHSDPDDPGRYVGWGEPLQGTSWRNRPFHMGVTLGILFGDDLISGQVGQDDCAIGAYRVGWDFDHYWGTEVRLAYANPNVIDSLSPWWPRECRNLYGDAHLLYYPWGDAKWRPFASMGLGLAGFQFEDDLGRQFSEVLFHMPLGLGVKYQIRRSLALRCDLIDNLAFAAAGLSTMHNVSLAGGIEVHWGGHPTSYYPWSPTGSAW